MLPFRSTESLLPLNVQSLFARQPSGSTPTRGAPSSSSADGSTRLASTNSSGAKDRRMATQAAQTAAPLPSPGLPTHTQASPHVSPAVSNLTLPNGAPSRPASTASAQSAASLPIPNGAPPGHVASPSLPPPPPPPPPHPGHQHAPPPAPQGQFYQGPVQHPVAQPHGLPYPPQQTHVPPPQVPPPSHQQHYQHMQQHGPPPNHAIPQPNMVHSDVRGNQGQPQGPAHGGQSQSHPPSTQLASPKGNAPKPQAFSSDYMTLANCLRNTPADVVRHVIRDNWELALLGSQYHTAFLMNATMHQADTETLSRAVQDFGGRMVKAAKPHVIKHLNAEDFDQVADILLPRVSKGFLDKALARRMETIPARQLVNALARAERLGYDVQDIVEEKHGTEHVIPSMSSMPQCNPVPVPIPVRPSQVRPGQPPGPPRPILPNAPGPVAVPSDSTPCPTCYWPCSAQEALDYHLKKSACFKVKTTDRIGKDFCPHCGSRFGSSGGLAYHLKTMVCGGYSDKRQNMMYPIIRKFREEQRKEAEAFASRVGNQPPAPAPAPTPTTARAPIPVGSSSSSTPQNATPERGSKSDWVTPNNDPYSKLTPSQREEFEREMRDAEVHYGRLMREAMQLPEPEQSKQLGALKNRYNTKQSVTRKKFGIRLRERRSKAQIEAERTRLFGSANGPSLSGRDGPPAKKFRVGEAGQYVTASPQPGSSQSESGRKRVPVSEMGGLSGSQATAEHSDPTAYLTASQPRHLQHQQSSPGRLAHSSGTQADPMAIDDSSETDSDTDSDSDGDGGDIPASVPEANT